MDSSQSYIALLRGINVSGQKLIKMADLRLALEGLDVLTDVKTYIQSGNIVFQSNEKNTSKIEELIHGCIMKHFGFDVPVLVRTPTYFQDALNQNPFEKELAEDSKKVYFTFLKGVPDLSSANELENLAFPDEYIRIIEDVIYFYSPNPVGNAKFNNKLVENKLQLRATTRNFRSLIKLLEMAAEG